MCFCITVLHAVDACRTVFDTLFRSHCCIFVLHLAHMPDSSYIYILCVLCMLCSLCYVFYACYVVHDVSSHCMICSM